MHISLLALQTRIPASTRRHWNATRLSHANSGPKLPAVSLK
jgi:hypothetical protein